MEIEDDSKKKDDKKLCKKLACICIVLLLALSIIIGFGLLVTRRHECLTADVWGPNAEGVSVALNEVATTPVSIGSDNPNCDGNDKYDIHIQIRVKNIVQNEWPVILLLDEGNTI